MSESSDRAALPDAEGPGESANTEPPATFIGDLRIPYGAVAYRVCRFADGRIKKVLEHCTLTPPGMAEAIERFPLSTPEGGPIPPSWSNVLKFWGSGFYAFQFLKANNAWGGWSVRKRLDDANFPPMPAHRKLDAQSAAPAQPAAPAPAPMPLDPLAMLIQSAAASGGGKIDASMAMALVMLVQQMNVGMTAALEARQRAWRQEDADRAAERERDHLRRLERERQFASEDRTRIEQFYTSARARETASAGDERMRRLEERLEEALDMLDDQAEPPAAAEKSITDQAIEQFLPVVAARFMAGPTPPAPPPPPEGTSK